MPGGSASSLPARCTAKFAYVYVQAGCKIADYKTAQYADLDKNKGILPGSAASLMEPITFISTITLLMSVFFFAYRVNIDTYEEYWDYFLRTMRPESFSIDFHLDKNEYIALMKDADEVLEEEERGDTLKLARYLQIVLQNMLNEEEKNEREQEEGYTHVDREHKIFHVSTNFTGGNRMDKLRKRGKRFENISASSWCCVRNDTKLKDDIEEINEKMSTLTQKGTFVTVTFLRRESVTIFLKYVAIEDEFHTRKLSKYFATLRKRQVRREDDSKASLQKLVDDNDVKIKASDAPSDIVPLNARDESHLMFAFIKTLFYSLLFLFVTTVVLFAVYAFYHYRFTSQYNIHMSEEAYKMMESKFTNETLREYALVDKEAVKRGRGAAIY